jgi:CBS domain-containing protein
LGQEDLTAMRVHVRAKANSCDEEAMRAKDVMTTSVASVTPENSVRHAAAIMIARRISGLPVLDDDHIVIGVVTEGDLMRRYELKANQRDVTAGEDSARAYLRSRSWRVGDVMTRPAVTVDSDISIDRIATLMLEKGIKRVPVVSQGVLVGIVSRADLLRGLATITASPMAAGDDALRRATLTRLRQDGGISGVEVTVRDGIVRLWGVVGSEAERDAARAIVDGIQGAIGVENHLRLPVASRS